MPRVAGAVVALAAVVALVVVLTRPGGGGSTQKAAAEVFLQPVAESGRDPFTESTAAKQATPPPAPTTTAPPPGTGTTATRSVSGSAPGLYGGTKDVASCDVERQIAALSAQPAKNAAFAAALGIEPSAVAGRLRALTPVQLRTDTRVTNHGYRDGRATPYQAVLQAGTAVLVDDRGVPRVRCACGNPLGAPVALPADPKRFGRPWPSYRPSQVVVIAPSVTVINKIVIYDHQNHRWYERDRGADPAPDRPVPPPVAPNPPTGTPSVITSPPSDTTSPSTPGTGTPEDTATASTPSGRPPDTPGDTGTPSGPVSKPPALTDRSTPSGPATPSGPSTPPPASPPVGLAPVSPAASPAASPSTPASAEAQEEEAAG